MTAATALPPVICLYGPTASGKSAAARALATRWPVEIVNVDSATIYRQMDIGTAKPSTEEREQVVHHLLDIRDPAETYSVAEFRQDALALIEAIAQRGHLPVLAGGTMMYFHVLQSGLADLPAADPALRQTLAQQAERAGWPALHQQLQTLDPLTAAELKPNDSQRIQRALEVCLLSGRPMSTLLSEHRQANRRSATSGCLQLVEISLEPSDRAMLHRRIQQRFDTMLELGLLDEVAALQARADLNPDLPSMRCVGYRQLWPYLQGNVTLQSAREQAIAATRQLAKRQLTWIRARPMRHSIDCLAPDATTRLVDQLVQITELKSWL